MKYALLMIYAMVGSGTAMGLEKGRGKEISYPDRFLVMVTWPIAVSAFSTKILFKESQK